MPADRAHSQDATRRSAGPEDLRRTRLPRSLALTCVLIASFVPATTALAQDGAPAPAPGEWSTGGVVAGTESPAGGVTFIPGTTGTPPNKVDRPRKPKHRRKHRRRHRATAPLIKKFALTSHTIFDSGTPLAFKFRIKGRGAHVKVALVVHHAHRRVATVGLSLQPTGRNIALRVGSDRLGLTRAGLYSLTLVVHDRKGRRAAHAAGVDPSQALRFATHRFPVAGAFTWGGPGARYGAPRSGHKHQGQDLPAAEGTPIVAPHAGTVTTVDYQAKGAGYYVVMDSDDEDYDFVFMHIKSGTTLVKAGEHVATGQQLAQVGDTGDAQGPHLHFEIWTGGHWFAGGHSIDPLPMLQRWYATGPGPARLTASAAARDAHD